MKKAIIIISICILFLLLAINILKKNPPLSTAGQLITLHKIQLSLNLPKEMRVSDEAYRGIISDDNFSLYIKRIMWDELPQTGGADPCGMTVDEQKLTYTGMLDSKKIYAYNDQYYAQRFGLYCQSMPLYTRKFPELDTIDIFYTFTNPSLTDEQKNAYRKTADEIVLSLQDVKE